MSILHPGKPLSATRLGTRLTIRAAPIMLRWETGRMSIIEAGSLILLAHFRLQSSLTIRAWFQNPGLAPSQKSAALPLGSAWCPNVLRLEKSPTWAPQVPCVRRVYLAPMARPLPLSHTQLVTILVTVHGAGGDWSIFRRVNIFWRQRR